MSVDEHIEKITLHDLVITPGHVDRKASAEFEKNVKRLKEDGHYRCWLTGSTDNLQVHHFGAEWSLAALVDFEKLKEFCETFDPYGYGRLLKNQPMTGVDDIRNLLVLSQQVHTGENKDDDNATGIHNLVFPMWIMQGLAKPGLIPVPQPGETITAAMARIAGATKLKESA
ncbi:hypothetical protein L4X63_09365 [Geomonas sp. Red32]|uniref:hypothetical protein n=1 Tax=Geomonas sp. Red32 TaxID=2912856 RepID=UPI00202CE13C|nr:hypothetical protein [Geomonas sp. Red32]MCM0081797.1 hypothetical protein [Geomonas sp. Red32]